MEQKTKVKKNYLLGLWRVMYPLLSYLAITIIVQIPFTIFYAFSVIKEAGQDAAKMQELLMTKVMDNTLVITLAAILVTLPFALWLMHADKKKQRAIYGVTTYKKGTIWHGVLIAVLAVGFCLAANNLIGILKLIELFPGYQEVAQAIYSGGFFLEILAVGIAAPVIEELLFRGLAHNRIKEYSNVLIATVLSALIFGIYHMNMVQGIYAFTLGILLSYVYEKFHTILAPILFHAAANIASVFLTEVEALHKLFEQEVFVWIITIVCLVVIIAILLVFHKVKLEKITTETKEEAIEAVS